MASRVVESTIIAVGLISLLSVVTVREDFAGAGADAGSLSIAGESLVAVHDWTFLLGPGFCVGVNGMLLGYLMYRSGLVPRQIAALGLIGGPLIFASSAAVLFDAYEQTEGRTSFCPCRRSPSRRQSPSTPSSRASNRPGSSMTLVMWARAPAGLLWARRNRQRHVRASVRRSISYTEIDPPSRLAFTWIWDGDDTRQLIEIEFQESEGVTMVRFTHGGLWDEESVRSHEDGRGKAFDNLERALGYG